MRSRRDFVKIFFNFFLTLFAYKYTKAAQLMNSLPYHHLPDGTFQNLPGSLKREYSSNFSYLSFFRFFYKGIIKKEMFNRKEMPDNIPVKHKISQQQAKNEFFSNKDFISVTWLGHASFLLKIGNSNILTDPYLSKTAGPFGFGPNRYIKSGMNFSDLPKINTILISHNHYDHLDTVTLKKFNNKKDIKIICPLKLSPIFIDIGYTNVIELDWYEENKDNEFIFTAVPAYHWSRRLGQKRNSTLWNGYLINHKFKKIFFSGDTAYGTMFKEIGKKLGPFDLTIIPIGAYEPRKMMQSSHCTPEEAVEITSMLVSRNILGMHWGTIRLSAEDPWEPPKRFKKAALDRGYKENQIWELSIGQTKSLI